ncbi:MAG TPA: hypothetical protein PKC98_23675, partial [Candidatus Melainabacteria bacterium]|nr:hypothetical protein [Candidatus Melainabacteria bacterium]
MTRGSTTLEKENVTNSSSSVDSSQSAAPSQNGPSIPVLGKISDKTKTRFKICFSLLMIASLFLFGKVDLSKSWAAALTAHKGYMLGAILLFLLSPVMNAQRWQLLAGAVGLKKSLLRMTQ